MMFIALLASLALGNVVGVQGWNIDLTIHTQAGGAVGGQIFDVQPIIQVNNKKNELQSDFEGRVTVQIDSSPSGKYEPVWKEGEAIPTLDEDTFISESVVNGQAVFTGLGINTASHYQLIFTLYDEHELIMDTVISDEFIVEVGEMYQLDIVTQPEMAFGGSVFGSQPLLAIQDRGGNVVTNVNEGMVAVSLYNSPGSSTLHCMDDNGFSINVKNGLAKSEDLYINEAGTHYSLYFSTDLELDGNSDIISNQFSVGVGPASEIALVNDASDGAVLGGQAFIPQLRAKVQDAGGNVLINDSSSAIRVSFYSNPSRGNISPESGTTQLLHQGIVQFRNLSIDKAGIGYRLKYEFLQYEDAQLKETSIFTYGSYFNVDVGPPHELSVLQHSSGGWAGNQPFPIQPKVALLDAGGNVVVGDSSSIVTVHVTPSLAYNSQVVIDTSNDDIPRVIEVVFAQNIKDDPRLLYGPNDVIRIDVMFSQEVTLFQTIDDGVLPQLILNTVNSGGDKVFAELVSPSQEGLFARIISFEYVVETGHSQTELDYVSSFSLYANDYTVEDAFGRSANLDLPPIGSGSSLLASKTIGVSDVQPKIESITADLPTGEYGAGEEIHFIATLDREVVVTGTPELPLSIQRCDESTCTARTATYIDGSGTKTLTFNYIIQSGDDTTRLDISETIGTELLFPIVADSISLLTNSPRTSPIQVDETIEGMSLPTDLDISIDTTPPVVMSIAPQTSSTPNGMYAVGDTLFFEVSFDKSVEVDVGLELALNTDNGVARYVSGTGSNTLLLQYTVEEGDVTPDLNFRDSTSLVAENTDGGRSPPIAGSVRRKSQTPTTDANLDISQISSIADNYDIVIDGARPQLLDVSFVEDDRGNTFARGDTLEILVQFSAPVVVNESSPPLLGLIVGTNERWATYSSGSGTSTLTFIYQVVVGDSSLLPSEFKYRRLCNHRQECSNDTNGLVVRLSANLELEADLNAGFSDQGIPITDSPETSVTIDTSMAPVTTVISTTTSKLAGTYGVGEIVDITVVFTDEVFLPGDSMPELLLNTNSFASFYSGSGTIALTFRYISSESDSISKLDWALDPTTDSAIVCTETCLMKNDNGVGIDTRFHDSDSDTSLVEPLEPSIELDPSPPHIASISTDKMMSPYCHPSCSYTVGEEIDIHVRFDRPVIVQGTEISLILDVGTNIQGNEAVFVPSRSTKYELVFVYTVGPNHSSNGASLNYVCSSESLCSLQLGVTTTIKRQASIPTLDVDLTLPPLPQHGLTNDELNPIIIDTSGSPPNIVDVSSTTSDGSYCPGDGIGISVQFSKSVVVFGKPYLTLNVGRTQPGIATFKDGSGTTTLHFGYVIGINDTTLDLEYNDDHSLHLGFDGVNPGFIKQASTNPTIAANIELPFPSTIGSLGSNSNIKIDSRQPFITLISATPGEYFTGDKIIIQVEFSRPVSVNGSPSLLLNAGRINRVAEYESQPRDHTIEFSYTVQLGDSTESLDYWSDERLHPSSSTSLHLDNGGWIRLKSSNPTLDADLHINPIDGFLDGDTLIEVTEGVAVFRDLKIRQRGKDYKIWFQTSVESTSADLQKAEMIQIDPSIEYEVQGELTKRDAGDLYGSAVSLHGNMLAVGAPGKQNPTSEVQVLTVFSEASVEEHEVQIIATSVNRTESIMSKQEFSTCANAGETIRGSFTLTYNVDGGYEFASPIKFDSDVSADQIKSVLEEELNLMGLIDIAKQNNPSCDSLNSWTWSVTFLDSSNGVGVLETNGDLLIGNGAYISQSAVTRSVDMLRGLFRLRNPFNKLISRDIPYDASSNAVQDVIQQDLDISVLSVQAENTSSDNPVAELGRRWTIIFSHHVGEYGQDTNVPQLEAISDNLLLGTDAHVWTHTGFEGRAILSGSFAMSFRGSDPSYFVAFDSSEEDIAAALESLDSVNKVTISNRREFTDEVGKSGCEWTITFDSVNKLTDYGWLLDPGGSSSHGNLPTLEITSRLIGWNAGYLVQSETGRGEEDIQAQWMVKQMGDDGSGSGSVDIFRKTREIWQKEATLLSSDYDSNDAFGACVSITDAYLLVGAPSKKVDGLPEQQTMTCVGPATDGYFVVSFRGFKSSPIPYDATLKDIQHAIIGMYGGTDNIHPTPQLLFTTSESSDGWDGSSSGFCSGSESSISITFLTPDGGGISTVEKRSGDLEMLIVDTTSLVGASISVAEQRPGTISPMGSDLKNSHPTGKHSGSAYLFQRHVACSYCEPVWTQKMKFTPMDGLDDPTDAAQFGWSSIFLPSTDHTESNLAIIGSPGFSHGSGKVYIFHVVQGSWMLLDSLTDINWNHQRIRGGQFGKSLAADRDTLLIGSPGHANKQGAVYVIRRSDRGKPFLASQAIYGPDPTDGDQFGHSIALFNNKAVVCAPHKTTSAVHISITTPKLGRVGACYVYSRHDETSAFKLDQQLHPSNVLSGDRFGWSVAISNNRIVVGQVEDTTDKIEPPRPVQVVKTYCEHPPCKNAVENSKFRLQWVDIAQSSPFLSASTSANQMRDAIETNLLSGPVSVSRSILPDKDGGHTWKITFDSFNSVFRDVNKIPPIHCEAFVTSTLSCRTHIEHDIPTKLRGKVHLFDFDETHETWTEQSFLFPNEPQKQDLLGGTVAIDGNTVVAGAPNREVLNVNSGAAVIYDITFLNLNFPDGSAYSLTEGDEIDINIERSSSDQVQVVSLRTMDPNAEQDFQHYINELFSLRSIDIHAIDKTPVELLTGNTAMGRSQSYGSDERRSLFIQGMYDIQAINDYVPLNSEIQFEKGESIISTKFKVNDDNILELPNEQTTIQFNMRGMFPSQLGRLKTNIVISDNDDGLSPEGRSPYQVLDGYNQDDEANVGISIDIDRDAGMLIVGSEGCIHTFAKRSPSGIWEFVDTLSPPVEDKSFGQSVAINKPYGRDDVTVLIGAPGSAAAFVYIFQQSTNSWTLQSKLTANDATLSSEDRFGGRNALALHEDMAFVGSSSMEQVYVFRRTYIAGVASWDPYSILRSSDYDFDIYGQGFTVQHMHHQGFGIALAASQRTLLVGAPHADYGNRGDVNQREYFDTDGIHNKGLGKGKVYAFYSQPHVQVVTLQSDEKISAGSFRLKLDGVISGYISHDSSDISTKAALEAMVNVGEVNVESRENIESHSYTKSWRISFLSNFADIHPTLIPLWYNHGCDDCDQFHVSVLSTVEPFVTATTTHSQQPYIQEGEMQPRDVTSTDMFGTSIALDGPQAIIGSMHSAAKTRTTWDFETGDLQGWSSTGTAFQNQPTFGDNSSVRAVYEGYGPPKSHTNGEPQSSRLVGRYYIATFDERSGEDDNYQEANHDFGPGSIQGDESTGTLTSDPFIIRGETISLLIGGGCDHKTVYVELLIDGQPSLRATGKCSERMDRVYWDVSIFVNRSGQIRIVDNSSHKWGHINADEFQFSWDMYMGGTCLSNNFGQCTEGGGALPKTSKSGIEKQHYTGREESPHAGAAYMFLNKCVPLALDDLSPSNSNCVWLEQERLVASDKRAGNLFGTSVDVDNDLGIAVVSSPQSPAYGFYQEPVSVHPYSNSTMHLPIPEDLENLMRSGRTYSATGGNVRLIGYLIHKGEINVNEASKFTEQAGSVYVYLREPAKLGPSGEIVQPPFWKTTEDSKYAPPNVAARDHFGTSLSLDGTTTVTGAPGRQHGGGAFAYDMEWIRVKFQQVEFVAAEGQGSMKIFVERDLSWSDGRYSLAYSTSDLTAVGVDTAKFDDCMSIPSPDRDGCGDYEQTSGVVTFNPGEQHAYFVIRIVDDLCIENHLEYVQLNLHQIGGSPLHGEGFRAQLRIDDEDWPYESLSMNCTA